MKALQLSLIQKWFDMTKAGIKTEDYREITPYWAVRLINKKHDYMSIYFWKGVLGTSENNRIEFKFRSQSHAAEIIDVYGIKHFSTNIMTLGYPKSTDTDRILKLEHKGIEIRTGNPEWGAQPGKLYFVIKHGKIL